MNFREFYQKSWINILEDFEDALKPYVEFLKSQLEHYTLDDDKKEVNKIVHKKSDPSYPDEARAARSIIKTTEELIEFIKNYNK